MLEIKGLRQRFERPTAFAINRPTAVIPGETSGWMLYAAQARSGKGDQEVITYCRSTGICQQVINRDGPRDKRTEASAAMMPARLGAISTGTGQTANLLLEGGPCDGLCAAQGRDIQQTQDEAIRSGRFGNACNGRDVSCKDSVPYVLRTGASPF